MIELLSGTISHSTWSWLSRDVNTNKISHGISGYFAITIIHAFGGTAEHQWKSLTSNLKNILYLFLIIRQLVIGNKLHGTSLCFILCRSQDAFHFILYVHNFLPQCSISWELRFQTPWYCKHVVFAKGPSRILHRTTWAANEYWMHHYLFIHVPVLMFNWAKQSEIDHVKLNW